MFCSFSIKIGSLNVNTMNNAKQFEFGVVDGSDRTFMSHIVITCTCVVCTPSLLVLPLFPCVYVCVCLVMYSIRYMLYMLYVYVVCVQLCIWNAQSGKRVIYIHTRVCRQNVSSSTQIHIHVNMPYSRLYYYASSY